MVGGGRVHDPDQRGERHRRYDLVSAVAVLGPDVGPGGLRRARSGTVPTGDHGGHAGGPAIRMVNPADLLLKNDLPATLGDFVRRGLPHHSGPVFRVLELLDERGDVLLVPFRHDRVHDGIEQREVLDTLRGPVRLDRVGRHPPHLLGVGLEEDPVQAPAKTGRDPALEFRLILGRPDPRPAVGEDAAHRLEHTEAAQGITGTQRVIE